MKTPAERAHLLLPSTQASMDDKWRAAWSLLDEDKSPDVMPEYRLHARCWLTYRTFEGHVKRDEFMQRVRFCSTESLHPSLCRWDTSISAAEFYLFTSWDMETEAMKAFASFQASGWWSHERHLPAVLHYLRMQAVRVYDYYISDMKDDAAKAISTSVCQWQSVMGEAIDWKAHPLRFMDGKGDMMALHALMCIGARIGMVPAWMQEHEKAIQDLKEPWALCLRHLSKRKGAIWK